MPLMWETRSLGFPPRPQPKLPGPDSEHRTSYSWKTAHGCSGMLGGMPEGAFPGQWSPAADAVTLI